jgi:putative oxidoreductase
MTQQTSTTSFGPDGWTGGRDPILLIGRVALGAIFLQSGFGKLTNLGGFTAGLEERGVPMASILGPVGAAVEFFAGLAVLIGAWTPLAAILLVGFTVVATLIAHRYWDVPDSERMMQRIQFMKNLSIVGGLLVLVAAGAGRFSLDGLRRRRA